MRRAGQQSGFDLPQTRSQPVPNKFVHGQFLCGLVALLAPGSCRLCEGRLLQATDYPVCETCLLQLHALPIGSTCDICGEPLPPESVHASESHGAAGQRCLACTAQRPRFVRATAFGLYDNLRPAIRLLKFEGVPSLAKPLGAMLANAILSLRSTAPGDLAVVPVPLFRGKRSYNQSTLLAEQALRIARRAVPDWTLSLRPGLLRRTRRTESQFLLSPAQRRSNLHGAFRADAAVRGLHVLLVDDVYTTGATAHECTSALLAEGAASVHLATLARAGRDTAVRWQPPALSTRQQPETAIAKESERMFS